jgi:hypothetical protein
MLPCTVETQKLHLEPAGESLKLFRYRLHERRQSKGQNPLNSKQMPRRKGFLVRPWPRHATTSPRFPRGRMSPRQKLLRLPFTLNSSFTTSTRAAFEAGSMFHPHRSGLDGLEDMSDESGKMRKGCLDLKAEYRLIRACACLHHLLSRCGERVRAAWRNCTSFGEATNRSGRISFGA